MTRVRVLAVVGVWVVLVGSLWATDADPAPLPLAGIVAVGAALGFAAFDLGKAARWVTWPRRRTWSPTVERSDARAVELRRQARLPARHEESELDERLIALVDDRLMARHAIAGARSPEAAPLLAPALTRLVAGRRRRAGAAGELHQIVSAIEEL